MTFGNYIMTLLPNQGDQTADGGDGRGLPDNEDVMVGTFYSLCFAMRRLDLPIPGNNPGTSVDSRNLFGQLQSPTNAAVLRLTTAFYAAWAQIGRG